jgi:hypothetical protein
MEERFWSARFGEPGFSQYSAGETQGYGYANPFWGAQYRQFQQPIQQLQNPYMQQLSPYGTFHFNPSVAQFQPLIPQQFAPTGISPYTPPSLVPIATYNAQPGFFNPAIQYGQPYWGQPFEAFAQQGQTLRPGSRAFGRPPRNYKRSDELIRDEICKRLAMTPEIDATDIEVIVKDGEVTLRGTVDDRFAKRLVEDITESCFGVRDVLNEVRVGTRLHEQELAGVTKGKEK